MTERIEKDRGSRMVRWLELFNPGDLFGTGDGKGSNGRGNREKGKGGGSGNGGYGGETEAMKTGMETDSRRGRVCFSCCF